MNKSAVLAATLEDLLNGDADSATARIAAGYPYVPPQKETRSSSRKRALSIFIRDGFIDRYSGDRLVYPGALRCITLLLPDSFPAHPNWKMTDTHLGYWELFPTLDHVVPIARGGPDSDDNLVTTSMLRNQAKSSWTLESLGWKMHPPGNMADWDGLIGATDKMLSSRPQLLEDGYLHRWRVSLAGVFGTAK